MDIRDGKIHTDQEFREKFPDPEDRENMVEFNSDDMIRWQRQFQQISLHDHRSKLGKILTDKRREMGIHRKK